MEQDLKQMLKTNEELPKTVQKEFKTHNAADTESGDDLNSPVLTPEQKLGFNKHIHLSASGASSDGSLKEESESSSSSLSDSDSESFSSSGNAYFTVPMNNDRSGFHKKIVDLGSDLPSMELMEGMLQMHAEEKGSIGLDAKAGGHIDECSGRFVQLEEELRVSKLKLQLSEDEVSRLKGELGKSDCLEALVGTLQAQLESAQVDIEMMASDLETERRRALELQKQIAECTKNFEGQLSLAHEEITMLKAKVDSQSSHVLGLQERIEVYEQDLSDRGHEIRRLNAALHDAQDTFSVEEAKLQSGLFALTEEQNKLKARLIEWESQGRSLEDRLWQCEAEKMESISLHEVQVIGLEGEISRLKVELIERCSDVEVLNKTADRLKYKNDVLMAEKDAMSAKVNTLVAEVSSKDNEIRQLEGLLQQLKTEHVELIAGSESVHKQARELGLRVAELEKEVSRKELEISGVAEEKREAIKQLCFSLEHYQSGYKELRQAFVGHRRHAVMAL